MAEKPGNRSERTGGRGPAAGGVRPDGVAGGPRDASAPGPLPNDPGGGLGVRIVHGGAWVAAQQAVQYGSAFLRTVVVARILVPEDLGLLGMALLVVALVKIVTETGFSSVLIQRKDLSDRLLHTAWTLQLLRGTVLFLILFLPGSLAVTSFFGEPRAAAMLRVLSVTVLLDGLTSLSVVLVQRRMNFRSLFHYQSWGFIAELLVSIALVVTTGSIWGVVVGMVIGALVRLLVSYGIGSYRPRLSLQGAEFSVLFHYGKWLTISSILLYLILSGPDVLVGKLLGAAALGFYQTAYRISFLPAMGMAQVAGRVMFPALSSQQEDLERVGSLFIRTIRFAALLTAPVAALLVALAEPFTHSVLGERWLPIVPLIRALALFGFAGALGGSAGPVFMALGRPDIRTKIQAGQLALLAAVIVPLVRAFDVLGVALAMALQGVVFIPVAVSLASRLAGFPVSRILQPALLPTLGAVVSAVVVYFLSRSIGHESNLWIFFSLVALGSLLYGGVMLLIDRVSGGTYSRETRMIWKALWA